jgi:hypothetical protein
MLPHNVRLSHIANALGLTLTELEFPGRSVSDWYLPTRLQPIGTKLREIDEPKPLAKWRLKRLAIFMGKELPVHPCAHGSVRGRSPFTAASRHLGNRHNITRDAKDCFPSVSPEAFRVELLQLGFRFDVAYVLSALLFVHNRLPQGSPASNAALNLFLYRTDAAIERTAARFGGRYTRYCDDLVISVATTDAVPKAEALLEQALMAVGLTANERKKNEAGVRLSHQPRLVNGVMTNSPFHTRLPRPRVAGIMRAAHALAEGCRSVTSATIETLAKRRRRLEGLACYGSQAGDFPSRELRELLRFSDAAVRRALNNAGLQIVQQNWWYKNKKIDQAAVLSRAWSAQARHVHGRRRGQEERLLRIL